jgi:hypothetical protein
MGEMGEEGKAVVGPYTTGFFSQQEGNNIMAQVWYAFKQYQDLLKMPEQEDPAMDEKHWKLVMNV